MNRLSKIQSKVARAFTLVEMLVALALTLILVYAIAHFYAILGDSVKDGRSMIEMNQQLRAVVERLKSDFDQLTIPVVPWVDEGGAYGYLEIKEGNIIGGLVAQASSDWDVNANNLPDAEFEFKDLNNDNIPDAFDLNSDSVADVTNLLGDCDDIIAMTIRAGATPFTGQTVQIYGLTTPAAAGNDGQLVLPVVTAPPTKISNAPQTQETTAPYAEVVWWTSFNDSEPYNGAWDFKESHYLHRRQLLIRPDLNVVHPGDSNVPSTPYFCRIPIPANLAIPQPIFLYDLHQYCDVSIRFDQTITASAGASSGYIYFVANSLADLCKRQNRFMHISSDTTGPGSSFPYGLDLNPNFAGSLRDDLIPDNPASLGNNTNPRHAAANNSPLGGSHYRWVLFDGGRKGEDIMLPNVLAFDIRVYDPEAVLRPDTFNPGAITGVLQPGDPGYHYAIANNFMTSHQPYVWPTFGLPTGAYVDLGYGVNLAGCLPQLPPPHRVTGASIQAVLLGTLGNSRFATFPATPASYSNPLIALYRNRLGLTYDTWTLAYERDGIDQDGNGEIDQGTDGIDSPINPGGPQPFIYLNGVDDASERETLPPYPHPLRGVQVRIRMYEPGTRQMRQATVIGDFVSE